MWDMRVYKGVDRGRKFYIEIDGEKIAAYEGETVAAALTAVQLSGFEDPERQKEGCQLGHDHYGRDAFIVFCFCEGPFGLEGKPVFQKDQP